MAYDLQPATMTEFANRIKNASNSLWMLYADMKRMVALATVYIGPTGDDWVNLAEKCGYATPEQAQQFYIYLVSAATQVQSEMINSEENALRVLMHKIG